MFKKSITTYVVHIFHNIGGFPMGAMGALAPTLFRQYICKLKHVIYKSTNFWPPQSKTPFHAYVIHRPQCIIKEYKLSLKVNHTFFAYTSFII